MVELTRRGETQLAIAAKLGLTASTVASWQRAGQFPERRIRDDRYDDQLRAPKGEAVAWSIPPVATHFAPSRVAGLLAKAPRQLKATRRSCLSTFFRLCPVARELHRLILRFRAMLCWRRSDHLTVWIETVTISGSRSSCSTPRLSAGTSGPWSWRSRHPGIMVLLEGQINRLRAIKRQMYGRAGVELLKARVLPFVPLLPAGLHGRAWQGGSGEARADSDSGGARETA